MSSIDESREQTSSVMNLICRRSLINDCHSPQLRFASRQAWQLNLLSALAPSLAPSPFASSAEDFPMRSHRQILGLVFAMQTFCVVKKHIVEGGQPSAFNSYDPC